MTDWDEAPILSERNVRRFVGQGQQRLVRWSAELACDDVVGACAAEVEAVAIAAPAHRFIRDAQVAIDLGGGGVVAVRCQRLQDRIHDLQEHAPAGAPKTCASTPGRSR